MSNFIDSHCHLYYEPYVNNIQKVLDNCKKNNVNKLLSIGVNIETSKRNIDIANNFNEIFCSIGIHPNEIEKIEENDLEVLKKLKTKSNKIIAIGEIGLDFYRNNNVKKQIYYFEKQIELSLDLNLPIIVHTRDAEDETINVLKKYKNKNLKFIIHCFSGSEIFSKDIIELNGLISFSGILTFKKSDQLRNICKNIPLEHILIETDSPYLSPEPYRGKINCPSNVYYVAKKISELKKIDLKQVADITSDNFRKFFSL